MPVKEARAQGEMATVTCCKKGMMFKGGRGIIRFAIITST